MMEESKHRGKIRILVLIGVLLLALSIFFLNFPDSPDFTVYRLLRGIICFVFLFLMINWSKTGVSKWLISFIVLYGLSSTLTIWFENEKFAVAALLLNLLSYFALIIALIPKVDFRKMNILFKLIFVSLVLVNGYLLFMLLEMIREEGLSNMQYFAMLVTTIFGVVLGFLALLYNHKYGTPASLIFCVFIFGIIFAEVFRAIGYYDFGYGDAAVYLARVLLIISLSYMVYFAMLRKEPEEQLA